MSTQSVCGSRIYPVQFINKNNIISEYAKDYKNEYLSLIARIVTRLKINLKNIVIK